MSNSGVLPGECSNGAILLERCSVGHAPVVTKFDTRDDLEALWSRIDIDLSVQINEGHGARKWDSTFPRDKSNTIVPRLIHRIKLVQSGYTIVCN